MRSQPEAPIRCPRTGIQHRWILPGGPAPDAITPFAVFFLNGIGLDLEGFREALQALERTSRYPYRHGTHVALTVPGFEDHAVHLPEHLHSMADQGQRVADFMKTFVAEHPAREVIVYGFSFGSDLVIEVLESLGSSLPITRVVLTEMNVHLQSCFITTRIKAAFAAARGRGQSRDREAYKGFVSQVVKASADGRISASLMQDMALYFRTIAPKNWNQLARSAEEVSEDPDARVSRLLGMTADRPGIGFDLVFSDPQDLRIFQRRLETWGGSLGRIRVLDSTAHEHFHHMSRAGVLENLCDRLPVVTETPWNRA